MKPYKPMMIRKPYRPFMIERAVGDVFHAMVTDITNTAHMRFKAANYHDAYDFAMKNFAIVDNPLFNAEEI